MLAKLFTNELKKCDPNALIPTIKLITSNPKIVRQYIIVKIKKDKKNF